MRALANSLHQPSVPQLLDVVTLDTNDYKLNGRLHFSLSNIKILSKMVSFSVAASKFIGKVLVTHYGNTNINKLGSLVFLAPATSDAWSGLKTNWDATSKENNCTAGPVLSSPE